MSVLHRITRGNIRLIMGSSHRRKLSLDLPRSSKAPSMDDINSLFAEARMSLQDAAESKGTVYFEDDFKDAKKATEDTLKAFEDLCASASAEERVSLLEANHPKMAQLEQEFKDLEDELIHDD